MGFETLKKSLQGSLMASTCKEPGWIRRISERIYLQVIKVERHDSET
jgi:hypothetical protein